MDIKINRKKNYKGTRNLEAGTRNPEEGYSENTKDNNTIINNTFNNNSSSRTDKENSTNNLKTFI